MYHALFKAFRIELITYFISASGNRDHLIRSSWFNDIDNLVLHHSRQTPRYFSLSLSFSLPLSPSRSLTLSLFFSLLYLHRPHTYSLSHKDTLLSLSVAYLFLDHAVLGVHVLGVEPVEPRPVKHLQQKRC